jgi:hypothetical protein
MAVRKYRRLRWAGAVLGLLAACIGGGRGFWSAGMVSWNDPRPAGFL